MAHATLLALNPVPACYSRILQPAPDQRPNADQSRATPCGVAAATRGLPRQSSKCPAKASTQIARTKGPNIKLRKETCKPT